MRLGFELERGGHPTRGQGLVVSLCETFGDRVVQEVGELHRQLQTPLFDPLEFRFRCLDLVDQSKSVLANPFTLGTVSRPVRLPHCSRQRFVVSPVSVDDTDDLGTRLVEEHQVLDMVQQVCLAPPEEVGLDCVGVFRNELGVNHLRSQG